MPEENDSNSNTGSFQRNEGKRYALVIGVNKSVNARRLPALQYAESDAIGIAHLLKSKCDFTFCISLTREAASTQNVRKAIIDLFHNKSENDLLLFYFIGHGCLVETRGGEIGVYLVTSDFDPDPRLAIYNPQAYLSLDWIREMLYEHQNTANVISILDCCDAGYITEPPSPERQLTQLLEIFATKIKGTEQSLASPRRTRAILASTEKGASAYELEGHTLMTGLILNALNGDARDALYGDNLTLGSLHDYLQRYMEKAESGKQHSIMEGTFGNRLILAHHPSEDPFRRSPQDFPKSPLKQPFDVEVSPTTFGDLDFEQVRTFLKKELVVIQQDYQADVSEQVQMEALGLLQGGYPNYGALLCFGHKPQLEIVGAYTRCVCWKDASRLSGWESDVEYRGSLLQQFTQACDFLRKHLRILFNNSSEQLEIPLRVLQEALANALIHREYVTVTTPDHRARTEGVQVEIFSDRIQISSPGELLAPLPLIGSNGSHPRNPQIMRIFYLAGHVEKLGTGIGRMRSLMLKAGLREPDIRPDQQTFTITLFRPTQPPEYVERDTQVLPHPNGSDTQPIEQSSTTNVLSSSPLVNTTPRTETPVTPMPPEILTDVVTLAPPTTSPNSDKKTKWLVWQPFTLIPSKSPRSLLAILCVLYTVVAIGVGAMGDAYFRERSLTPTSPSQPASTTIEIASDFPTSGVDIISGLPLQNGVQMAITEANNKHLLPSGYTLQLVPYNDAGSDNRHDPQVGANNLKLAIADNLVAGVIGPYNSSVAFKELPIVNRAPLALLSPDAAFSCLTKSTTDDPNCTSTNDIAAQMRPTGQLTFFRLVTTTDRQGKASADYFFQTKHYSKVLLLRDESDPYSSGLALAFQKEWQRIGGPPIIAVDLRQSTSGVQDYQNILQGAASFQPDLIYFSGGLPNGSDILQALFSIAALKTVPFAGGGAIMKDSFLRKVAYLHRDAPVYISMASEDPAHSGTNTEANFETKYNTANGYQDYIPDAATAYDCTMMLIQAIKIALQKGVSTPHGTQDHAGAVKFRQAVLQELRHLSYKGATGTHSFDANGDTTNHTISFYQADLSTPQPSWTWLQSINS